VPRTDIQLERLAHVPEREGHEDRECDYFLNDLQLRQRHHRVADAIGRHLEQILEQRDTPARERCDEPGLAAEILEMGIPGESHEYVGQAQQPDRLQNDVHSGGKVE